MRGEGCVVNRLISGCVLVLLFGFLTFPVSAQVDVATATIRGTVLDPTNVVIPSAKVTILNSERGFSKTVTTGEDGTYVLPLLLPGVYRVEVEVEGFQRAVANNVELTIGQVVTFDAHLKLGMVTNEVDVTEQLPLLEGDKTQQANTLATLQIDNLPNIGRNFTESVFTLPGVSSSDAPRAQFPGYTGFVTSGFSIGGSNGRTNLITFDGGENDYGSGQLRTPNVSVESVEEFQVNRSAFNAEFGFTAGTAVNVVTKSGTNTFHGSAYGYFRDEYTEARNYFDTLAGTPFDQSFFPGFTLGGPLKKNKLFFFTSYEYRRIDTAQFRPYLSSPEVQGINGSPDQLNYVKQLAASGNPTLVGLAGYFDQALLPMSNPSVAQLINSSNGIFDDYSLSHDWVTRLDYQPTEKDTFAARLSLEHWNYTNIGSSSLYAANDAAWTYSRDYTLLGTWNHIFSAALLNQARLQVVPENSASQVPLSQGTTELSIGNMGTFNQSYTDPYDAYQRRFELEDSMSWIKGNHTIKFGASYRPVYYKVQNNLWFGGEFDFFEGTIPLISIVPASAQTALATFNIENGYPLTGPATTNLSALESFSLGLPVDYRQGFGNPTWNAWANYLGTFVQDSWKVRPGLTLDYGVRLDYDAEPSPVPHNTYFSPRLGFAWQPFGDKKTVIRAGSGIFVAPVNFMIPYLTNLLNSSGKYINQVATTLSSTNETVLGLWATGLATGQLPFGQLNEAELQQFGLTAGPNGNSQVIFSLAPNYKNAYTVQASMSIARELTQTMSLEVGYQYYRGVHLPVDQEINYQETGVWDPEWGPQYTPINPNVVQNNAYSSIGNSTYNGLTGSFTKRYSANFQMQANYTFSKAIDDVTDFNSQFASFFPTRLYLERGISAYNVKNNFVTNAVYRTPYKAGNGFAASILADIMLSPIVYLRSGVPFDIRVPGAENGTQGESLYARPWYVPRTSGIGPDYYDFDLRLTKAFYFDRERGTHIDAIVEGTDLLNHTNFSSVDDEWAVNDPFLLTGPFNVSGNKNLPATSPLGFMSSFPGRQLQFALKFAW